MAALVRCGFGETPGPCNACASRSECLLELSSEAVLELDEAGLVRYANPVAADLAGLSARELLGRPIAEMLSDGIAGRPPGSYPAVLARMGGEKLRVQVVLQRLEAGSESAVRLWLSRCPDGASAEPQEPLLRAASAGVLVRRVIHDVNNLLSCVLACARAAQDVDTDTDRARNLLAIEEATRSAVALLHLLGDAHGPTALESPDETRSSASEVLRLTSYLLARLGARSGVKVRVEGEDVACALSALKLQQIVLNLGLNAVEAMPRGGDLVLSTRPAGTMAVVAVADTGPGIAPEHLAHIFDPGFSTKGGRGVRGVGLAVVKQLAESAGGRVEVQSVPGAGTRFEVILPRAGAGKELHP